MIKARKFVIGDIHGHYLEMMELFEKIHFNYDYDTLICLGDVVDSVMLQGKRYY